ncbi:hypothetical protein [Candidatus Berkiella aquae]|uniref:Uncharacterized protein n=1 Tax=Candidatus Berkiella aquae TaxID=295108 RepID=A0A0Q9YJP5_9GAMM|nr:hypothetical protein [Candidatus Berkiella aquae]MCS5711356.1 hypothetical protein [Candidatus Berkiella aquae]
MLLKAIKEVGRVLFTLGNSALLGTVAGITYIAANGFKCVTSNLQPGVTFDFGQLNYTELYEMFLDHNGSFQLPIEIHPSLNNPGACAIPVIVGAAVGTGTGLLWLAAHYAEKQRKQTARTQAHQYDSERERFLTI